MPALTHDFRQYVVLRVEGAILEAYRSRRFDPVLGAIAAALGVHPSDIHDHEIEVGAVPTLALERSAPKADPVDDPEPSEIIISYRFSTRDAFERFSTALARHFARRDGAAKHVIVAAGADPRGISLCDMRRACHARSFGTRTDMRARIGTAHLPTFNLTGEGVHVCIVDQGLNMQAIEAQSPGSWGGGWNLVAYGNPSNPVAPVTKVVAGTAPRESHGVMMARNILDIAPKAKLYDLPLIPPLIADADTFASMAHAAFKAIIESIEKRRQKPGRENEAWILVNAWAIFDRSSEEPLGGYTMDQSEQTNIAGQGSMQLTGNHPLNREVSRACERSGIDVVFGAGNCGSFSGSRRCGARDRGEGRSIWGANAHPGVVTVGAVSTYGSWMGYSSQGPAPWGGTKKPDLVAPSQFREDDDAAIINSGTSAATAITAGVMAAVRSNPTEDWGPKVISPAALKAVMIASAFGQGGIWNERTGHGLLDVTALCQTLPTS